MRFIQHMLVQKICAFLTDILQTPLLISTLVRAKIKISFSCWWCWNLHHLLFLRRQHTKTFFFCLNFPNFHPLNEHVFTHPGKPCLHQWFRLMISRSRDFPPQQLYRKSHNQTSRTDSSLTQTTTISFSSIISIIQECIASTR